MVYFKRAEFWHRTGIGKSFLACAFVERACRRGFTGCYVRASRLVHDLGVARGDGSYVRLLSRLAKVDLLAIDDWLLHPLKDADRRDLMEVLALFTVGDVYVSSCKRVAYALFSAQRRSRALFWL